MYLGCGGSFHLSRLERVKITSPTHEGHYEAEVVCHWTVQTDSPLWIKINVHKLILEDSANCTRDYVNVTGIGRVCGSRDKFDTVVKDTKIEIIFRTDYQIESEGFVFDVVAVGLLLLNTSNSNFVEISYYVVKSVFHVFFF
jgi:hypothetical protein